MRQRLRERPVGNRLSIERSRGRYAGSAGAIENTSVSNYSCEMNLKKRKAVRLTQEVKAAG
jgi:hypothetical protein